VKLFVLFAFLVSVPSVFAQYKNESSLSVVITGGNTETELYNGKTKNSYKAGKNSFSLGGHYMYGTNQGVESARNWDLNSRYEREVKKDYGIFTGLIYEADDFANIDYRINADLGLSYHIFTEERLTSKVELGYRYREEKSLAGTTLDQHQGRVYGEIERYSKSKEFSSSLWIEYLPNFTDGDDWQLNFEPGINYNINSSLALKWGYLGKYDNQPVAPRKFDFIYTTSLIAKF